MITQYYIAWENHTIFTSREELIREYVKNNYGHGYDDWLDDYLSDNYTMREIFEMSDAEKEVARSNLEENLWTNIVSEWDVDILEVSSYSSVSLELERL